MKSKVIVIGSVVLLIALIGFRLSANKSEIDEKNKLPEKKETKIPVTVSTVKEGSGEQLLVRTGNLIPFKEANIMATAQGKVLSVGYELGTYVKKGAPVVQVDSRLKELSLEATQLSIDKLKKDADRYTALYAGNAATELQLNDTRYNFENAVNQSAQIRQQIEDTRITAPISGRVVKKNIEAGEYVNVGAVLGTILDVSRLKVQVMVSESDVYKLREGDHVTLSTDVFPEKKLDGRISYISPQGDETHNYPVEIVLQNSGHLRSGTFVTVTFSQKSSRRALLIPRSALVESIRNPYVYIVENGTAAVRKIKVGKELGSDIEVLDGLQLNDTVVVSGQINLSEGKAVQVTR